MNSAPSSMGAEISGSCRVHARPPTWSRASRTRMDRPELRSSAAAASPETPAPMMTTSHEASAISRIRKCYAYAQYTHGKGTRMHYAQYSPRSNFSGGPPDDAQRRGPKSGRAIVDSKPRTSDPPLQPPGRYVAYPRRTGGGCRPRRRIVETHML